MFTAVPHRDWRLHNIWTAKKYLIQPWSDVTVSYLEFIIILDVLGVWDPKTSIITENDGLVPFCGSVKYLQQRDDDEDDGHRVEVPRNPFLQRSDAAFSVDMITPLPLQSKKKKKE